MYFEYVFGCMVRNITGRATTPDTTVLKLDKMVGLLPLQNSGLFTLTKILTIHFFSYWLSELIKAIEFLGNFCFAKLCPPRSFGKIQEFRGMGCHEVELNQKT